MHRARAARRRTPRRRDPKRTSAEILAAATQEFTQFGLAGARVNRIAQLAGANKRMLYHYFGKKNALFLAALEYAYEQIRAAERKLDLMHLPPRDAIARLTEFTWSYYLAHPEFLSLLNTENLCAGAHLKKSKKIRSMHSPFIDMLRRILKRGVQTGEFRQGVDPVQLYISIAGLGYFYLSNRYTLSAIFGEDLMRDRALRGRREHIKEAILGYLRPLDRT